MEAMLVAVGRLGLERTAVQDALDLTRHSRARFYELFDNKADCFARAHDAEAERLCGEILAAARAEAEWARGVREGLRLLLRFVGASPPRARALLIEGRHAHGRTATKHEEVVGRLSQAVDSARRAVGTQHTPPPSTAKFMVAAVESAVCRWLGEGSGSDAISLLPGLVHFSVLYYFGEETALRALGET
jgi:AcrR family transcriptional regulator